MSALALNFDDFVITFRLLTANWAPSLIRPGLYVFCLVWDHLNHANGIRGVGPIIAELGETNRASRQFFGKRSNRILRALATI